MKQNSDTVPRALREVWTWKDSIYRKVKDLPIPQAVSAVLDRAAEAREHTGFPRPTPQKHGPARVAEDNPGYDAPA